MDTVSDALTLTVYVANMSPHAVFVVPGASSERVFCIRSLRKDTLFNPSAHAPVTNIVAMQKLASTFRFYPSARAYVRSEPGKWRSLRMVCTGCGKPLSRHK